MKDLEKPLTPMEMKATQLLRHDLFKNYDKNVLPVLNPSDKVEIAFGLALLSLDIDEQRSTLKSNVWARLVWQDEHLKWNESDYDNITVLRIPPEDIWTPDLYLFNR